MIKKYKKTLILTSLVLLIPVIVGLLLWNQLPDPMPSHWNIHGEVDGWSSKAFAVFGLPALMIVLQWICVLASTADPKHKNYNPKMMKLVLWICPAIGLILSFMVYPAALGYSIPVEVIMPLIIGVLFIIVGNWLPKCPQTYTMGIKLPWTLANEENWNKTHRFSGKLWVAGGVITMATAFLGSFWILLGVLVVMVVVPTVYSYTLYRKQKGETHESE